MDRQIPIIKFSFRIFIISMAYFVLFTLYYIKRLSEFGLQFDPAIKYTLFSCLTSILISMVMLSISIALNPAKLNLALFWLFNLIFLGLGQLSFLFDPNPYYLARIAPRIYAHQASIVILTAITIGTLTQVFLMKQMKSDENVLPSNSHLRIFNRAKTFFWLYFILLLPVAQLIGGVAMLFRSIRVTLSMNELSLPVYSLGFAFCYALPLVNAVVFLSIRKYTLGKYQSIYTALIIAWCVLISNPLATARQTSLFMILPLVYFLLRKNSKLIVIFYAALAAIIVYQPGTVNRFTGKLSVSKFIPLSQNGDFDAFPQISNGLYALAKGAFPLFNQIFGSVLFFIPRSIWFEKPLDTGIVVAQFHGLSFQNLSAPWVLELFVNGRYPALLIGTVLVVRYLFKGETQTEIVTIQNVNIIIVFGLLFILMRGSLLQATGITLFSLLICRLHFPNIKN